jgi:hypothetical protein
VKNWNPVDKICNIEKTKEHHDRILKPFRRLTSEIENALKLRTSLKQKRTVRPTEKRQFESGCSMTTSDEVLILSPPKRSKPDILLVDLTI